MWKKIGTWIDDYPWVLVQAVCGFLFGFFSLTFSDEFNSLLPEEWQSVCKWISIFLVILTGIALVVAALKQARHQESISALQKDLEEARSDKRILVENVQNLVEGFLLRLATDKLGFGKEEKNTERISMYLFDPSNDFVQIGRYSPNPDYNQTGRGTYPANKGCIAECWKNDWFYCNDFPEPEKWDDYVAMHGKFGVSKTTVEKLRMKSRIYCGVKIANTAGNEPLGLVVIESTDPNRFDEDQLRSVLQKQQLGFLSDLAEGVRPYIANPSDLREIGM